MERIPAPEGGPLVFEYVVEDVKLNLHKQSTKGNKNNKKFFFTFESDFIILFYASVTAIRFLC